MDSRLLQTATALLAERGWSALSMEAIAERAGVSRATVWRHGLTRGAVERVLRQRLAADYQDLVCRQVSTDRSAEQQLTSALISLCAVAERNLPLLAHTETAFHGPDLDAAGISLDYFGPWLRILEQAAADGSIPVPEDRVTFIATVTNMVLLTYVHTRAHHADAYPTPEHTARSIVDLATRGFLPSS
ncbi:helix-turn-helix domain-containing protein [Asanoa sp. NPDC049573]|uniref:TetR/AcrR family transcriptional regulator n=1 Tax=Asanoa sp. NPDC049573 TaxID=3155396 RepID=UPI003420A7DD